MVGRARSRTRSCIVASRSPTSLPVVSAPVRYQVSASRWTRPSASRRSLFAPPSAGPADQASRARIRAACLDLAGGALNTRVLLRDLGSPDGCRVNGIAVRHCWLQGGDQVVFEGNQRFVLEVPLDARAAMFAAVADAPGMAPDARAEDDTPPRARRWPWLLLSALLLGGAISALLLFGAR